MAFELDIGFTSRAGLKDVNEDFCGALLPEPGSEDMGAIAAIADGVSQGGKGREAAQTTVISLLRDYFGTPATWDATVALDRIISAQNAWLSGINQRRQPALGLTTLTALVLRGQSYALAHVGDSRAYLLRGGETEQMTNDHVVHHPDFQHQLLRAVGVEDQLVVDYVQGDLAVGDVFVLLTDGVHGRVPQRRLAEMLDGTSAQDASVALVDAALKAGSDDNVSALVVRVKGLLDATLQDQDRAAQTLAVPQLMTVGEVLDGLVVTMRVADSGINVLYQVRDPASKKLYALKTLHPDRAHDPDERAMLAHEAWLGGRMQGSRAADNLVRVHVEHPAGLARNFLYVLYDWHAGETLQQQLDHKQTRPQVAQVLTTGAQALKALGRLHRQGVIHRDIKPANLHQGSDGVLRVLDLGVALSGREPASMRQLHAGTPSYINPEQWGYSLKAGTAEGAGELPNAQSDLFALGVTLYQVLTRHLPYGEVLPYQVGRYYRDPTPPSRHNPEIPIWLDHVLLKAVSRDKRLRFETAEEFLLALERGASRPLSAPSATPLIVRDPTALWKIALGVSVLFNFLLMYWVVFLPK
jgi:serine/threonine protein phosphatase PrpC